MQENHKTLFVLDGDRTLIHTDHAFDVLLEYAREHGLEVDDLISAERDAKQQGISFDPLAHLMKFDGTEDGKNDIYTRLQQLLVGRVSDYDSIRMPGVNDLLYALRRDGRQMMIHTYGGDIWQKTKLHMSDLNTVPHIITQTQNKAQDVIGWKADDGQFHVELEGLSGPYERIIYMDDKESNLTDLPEGATGVHVVPEGNELVTKTGIRRYRVVGAAGMLAFYEANKHLLSA